MEDIFDKMQRLAGVPKTETKSKSINENKNTVEDVKKMIRESFLAEKKKKEDETSTEEVDMMSDLTDETDTETTDTEASSTETPSEVDSGAKDIQDHLEAALEGAKSIGDEKLIDQIGNTITFLVRSHVVKENEELGHDGFKEGKINLILGSYYDIMDQGDGETRSDNQYLGFDLNTQEHIFRAMNAPGSTRFHFTMIPDGELLDSHVKESI